MIKAPAAPNGGVDPERPHLVMAVGNLVVGDSRVEKAAISAHTMGYKVTVVGVRRRTVQQVSFIGGEIPIIRIPIGQTHHQAVADALNQRTQRTASRKSRINRMTGCSRQLAYLAHRALERGHDASVQLRRTVGLSWRKLWPHIADYEAAFFSAFCALEPDLIHVHDRHPLPGAAAYARWNKQQGDRRPVRWLYDAHEFVPTQHMHPPVEHHQGWIAAEHGAITQADAVVTVSEQIALMLQRRHKLAVLPTVLRNQPSLEHARGNQLRTDVRTTAGLPDGAPLAVYVGGLAPWRGLSTLIDAQQLLPDLHVAVVGNDDPVQRAALRQQALHNETSERLHLLDYVPAAHVSRFISTADVGVSPLLDTPAHRTASPTKVAEYLHAHLPVVVSDLRAQAEQVRSIGFGEPFTSGDPVALADALRKVLSERERYRGLITDAVILENSWEADEPALQQLWSRLSPADRERRAPDNHPPELVTLSNAAPVLDELGSAATLPLLCDVQGELTDPTFMLTADGLRFLEFWRTEIAAVRGVLYDTTPTLVEGWDPAVTTAILTMSGKPSVRMLTGEPVLNVDRLRETYPDHWLHEAADDEADALRARFASVQSDVREHDRAVVTDDPTTAVSLGGNTVFIPPVLEVEPLSARSREMGVRIGWLSDLRRSTGELDALVRLDERGIAGSSVHMIRPDAPPADLLGYDVVIDSLTVDFPSPNGIRALSAGCTLMLGPSASPHRAHATAAAFIGAVPALRATPESLHETLSAFVGDSSAREQLLRAAHEFSHQELSADAVRAKWLRLLD